LSLLDPDRVERRDAKLWRRELEVGRLKGKMKCTCTDCKGFKVVALKTALAHHAHPEKGRHPLCRTWQGQDLDSSDEEWNRDYIPNYAAQAIQQANSSFANGGQAERGTEINEVLDEELNSVEELAPVPAENLGDVREDVAQAGDDAWIDGEIDPEDGDEDLDSGPDSVEDSSAEEDENVAAEEENERTTFDFDGLLDGERDVPTEATAGEEPSDPLTAHLEEATKPLYPGAKIDLLSTILLFMSVFHDHGFTNTGVDALLSCLVDNVLPEGHCLPRSLYSLKLLLKKLELNYVKIPACTTGCVLFYGLHEDLLNCPKCGAPKLKKVGNTQTPARVIRYFPVIPRLRLMYGSSSTSKHLTWHHENKSTDGLVRHVADSKAWKHVDENVDPTFAAEPRNIRFGFALDGVNPFSNGGTTWSTWPLLLVNYNLPPWLTTKKDFIMLAMLIPGPKSVGEKELDVFMQPLIDDLNRLWSPGVPCVDALSRPGLPKHFNLRAVLLWTVNDYPAYGLISGQVTHGYQACVVCGPNTECHKSERLKKFVYRGHRRFLKANHPFRRAANAEFFDGNNESRPAPQRPSNKQRQKWGEATVKYLERPGAKAEDQDCPAKTHGVKRVPCLFKLPYWEVRQSCPFFC
jgi:hypothetical protein